MGPKEYEGWQGSAIAQAVLDSRKDVFEMDVSPLSLCMVDEEPSATRRVSREALGGAKSS